MLALPIVCWVSPSTPAKKALEDEDDDEDEYDMVASVPL